MVVTEFRERVVGSRQRRVIGTVVVDEATGGYTITGRLEIERISILDRKAPGGRLWLRDDPARWARTCHRAFRSGYLVAVVVADATTGMRASDQ
ncbi:hypothetical protein OED01_12335 [Microbacterium sp. M28]|uniref:hypothetical protein n=1 Tax=Microbacterium sp. M28 TaxID=2962064 RepID=UPI0021F476C6|nr:hypothetical protein [Microbacterium sp. M28]UYO96385.1 hypothetical protein OED01_12335 [Microbacterium sp. M28]